ncbi:unnamed protein product [Mycena citricolor]|uniref:Hydrophobin n=2 Tax=Mycena citricolor TaxID=2018698 RepID=A0AAD2Q7K1_9AGAR|nr:unnamed protein product [Mycena citricolor]
MFIPTLLISSLVASIGLVEASDAGKPLLGRTLVARTSLTTTTPHTVTSQTKSTPSAAPTGNGSCKICDCLVTLVEAALAPVICVEAGSQAFCSASLVIASRESTSTRLTWILTCACASPQILSLTPNASLLYTLIPKSIRRARAAEEKEHCLRRMYDVRVAR